MNKKENKEGLEAATKVGFTAIEQAGKVGVEKAKTDRKIGEKRYDSTTDVAKYVTGDKGMTSADKKDVIKRNSDNNSKVEKGRIDRDAEIAKELWKTLRLGIIVVGVWRILEGAVPKIIKSCKGIKFMTMDDLVRKARPNAKLEHYYIEVLHAVGEVKQLKRLGSEEFDEELYGKLTQLKAILEALIFKGSYGVKVEVGAKKLSKLITDIAKEENFTSGWMANLDEEERRTLHKQAHEIMESIALAKTKKNEH